MESAPPPAPAVIEIADGDLEVKAPAGDAVADGTPKDANTNGSKGQQSLLSFFGALKPPRSESGGPSRENKPTTNGEGDAGRARPRQRRALAGFRPPLGVQEPAILTNLCAFRARKELCLFPIVTLYAADKRTCYQPRGGSDRRL